MAIDQERFGEGLGVIALQLNAPLTPEAIKAFHAALRDDTDPEEWAAFCAVAVKRAGWAIPALPGVAVLMDALHAFRGMSPLIAEATEAYDRATAAGIYTPEGGTTWTYRAVRESCGPAAAEAFLAAGGGSAFSGTWDESRRRERFVAAYAVAVRSDSRLRLLPAGPMKALPPAEATPSREEARAVVERLRVMAGVEPEQPRAVVVVASEDRLRLLRRQAEIIMADEMVKP